MTVQFVKAHCPDCGPNRNAWIVAEQITRFEGEEYRPGWTNVAYRLLKCRGCERFFFQTCTTNQNDRAVKQVGLMRQNVFNETLHHYPTVNARNKPTWVEKEDWTDDEKLRALTSEMYAALDNGMPVLAAVGMRTVFDAATELLGIDAGGTFPEKLDKMLDLGKIGREEREQLNALVDAGSAAAHRGWKPEPYQLDTMANILEGFLYRAFLVPMKTQDLKSAVPKRNGSRGRRLKGDRLDPPASAD